MKCPVCQDKDHRLYDRGTQSTCMGTSSYYENGVYHYHDPNKRSTAYDCSNGHMVFVSSYGACPAGDYGGTSDVVVRWKCDVCKYTTKDTPDADCSYCERKNKE